jgi:hypothetical protein
MKCIEKYQWCQVSLQCRGELNHFLTGDIFYFATPQRSQTSSGNFFSMLNRKRCTRSQDIHICGNKWARQSKNSNKGYHKWKLPNKIHDKYATKRGGRTDTNKSTISYTQSHRDQVASDSAQKQQRYWKKNTTNI